MKANLFVFFCILIAISVTLLSCNRPSVAQESLDESSSQSINHNNLRSPNDVNSGSLMFIENVGQFPDYIRFKTHLGKATIWLLDNTLWVSVIENQNSINNYHLNAGISNSQHIEMLIRNGSMHGMNRRISFPGANPYPSIEPFNPITTHISYFIGNDSEKWITNVPVWGGIRYIDIYPGIDLEITGANGQFVQNLVMSDSKTRLILGDLNLRPTKLSVQVEGNDTMTVDGDTKRLNNFLSELNIAMFQKISTNSSMGDQVGQLFAVSTLHSQSNISSSSSDLIYSTFLGGSGIDWVSDLALGINREIYAVGGTYSPEFPITPGAFDVTFNIGEAWVVKINTNTSSLDYATFLGGSENDWAESIAVDENGIAVIAGGTESSDFPTTPGAFDTSYNNPTSGSDGFVVKLNSSATDLIFATYLGGSSGDSVRSIFLDSSGNVYTSGATMSSDFPTTPGAFDITFNGGSPPFLKDGFVVKLNQLGSSLIYATFLGGSSSDDVDKITVDESGSVYVTGLSTSPDFPTTSGAFDQSYNGGGG